MNAPTRLATPAEARTLLHEVLQAGSDRLAHSLAVGQRAQAVASALATQRAQLVTVAGYLHDVGYAMAAVSTGMHQLDGARFLRGLGHDLDLCRLVAHHTFARVEARNLSLAAVVQEEFPDPDGDLSDLLDLVSYCDLTTSNTGTPTTVSDRLANVFARYAPDHVVSLTMREVEPHAHALVATVQARLDNAQRATPTTPAP